MRELGRVEGISGARVCQIVGVFDLPLEILERVDVGVEDIPSGISVTWLREIAACRDRGEQWERFLALVGARGSRRSRNEAGKGAVDSGG